MLETQRIRKLFSKHLRSIRIEKYKYMKEITKCMNVSYNTYRSYEVGNAIPTIENLVKIKEGFNISFEKLFEPFLENIEIDKEYLEIELNLKTIKTSKEHWPTIKKMIQLCYQAVKDKENLYKKRDTGG